MCNINILITKSNKNKEIKNVFLSYLNACASSYATNTDGDGYFCNGKIKKSFNFLNRFNLLSDFKKSKIIISHQRIATSGYTENNLQPFSSERFVFVHNGILDSEKYYSDATKSDSLNFFNLFLIEFEKNKDILKTLKKLFTNEYGYYSIAILDRLKNTLYYIKNATANISFYLVNNNSLYITTKENNKIFFNEPIKEYEIKNNTLYSIDLTTLDVIKLQKFKEFKKVRNYYHNTHNYKTNYKRNYYNFDDDLDYNWSEKDDAQNIANINKFM